MNTDNYFVFLLPVLFTGYYFFPAGLISQVLFTGTFLPFTDFNDNLTQKTLGTQKVLSLLQPRYKEKNGLQGKNNRGGGGIIYEIRDKIRNNGFYCSQPGDV